MDEARLMGNGILRYSTGDNHGWWCQIDARSDPAHQFGGKWSAWAWKTPIRQFAEFAARASFDTPEEALATLNSWLEPQGLRVLAPDGGFGRASPTAEPDTTPKPTKRADDGGDETGG